MKKNLIIFSLLAISLVLYQCTDPTTTSIPSKTGEISNTEKYKTLDNYDVVSVDVDYLQDLALKAEELKAQTAKSAEGQFQTTTTTLYKEYEFTSKEKPIQVYTSLEKLQIDVQTVELEAHINDEPISVHKNLKQILFHTEASPGFLHFFNQNGNLVITDTLYTLKNGVLEKKNLETGAIQSKDLEIPNHGEKREKSLTLTTGVGTEDMDPCNDPDVCGGGGGGGGDGGGDDGSGREDYLTQDFTVYDIYGMVKCFMETRKDWN